MDMPTEEWEVDREEFIHAFEEIVNDCDDSNGRSSQSLSGIGSVTSISPGSSTYWIPTCDRSLVPIIGKTFSSVEEGINFYRNYAATVGFDARLSSTREFSDGTLKFRYMVCSRSGCSRPSESTGKRLRLSSRIGCIARVCFKYVKANKYEVSLFEERHNHALAQDLSRSFLKGNRKVEIGHQKFVINCAKVKLGASKSYNLLRQMMGGVRANVGPLITDLNNFKRDLMAFVTGADAQMVIYLLQKKQDRCSAFYFAYALDGDQCLSRLFWCDPMSRLNYSIFGEVVSFDSTYRTNK